MKKLKLYMKLYKNAIVEVHDDDKTYLSAIPWMVFLREWLTTCSDTIKFVPPWKITLD